MLRRGYCVVEVPDTPLLGDLVESALRRPGYSRFRLEFETAFLGSGDPCKVLWLEHEDEELCETIEAPAEAIAAVGGFVASKPLLRAPLGLHARLFSPEPLSEEDIEEGLVEAHLDFIQRRRLCLLRPLGEGGLVDLFDREGGATARVHLPRSSLLIFQHDELDYSYNPQSDEDLLIQCWLMAEPQRLRLDVAEGGPEAMEAVFGGPPQPRNKQVHIMSGMCRFPGSARHLLRDWMVFIAGVDLHTQIPLSRFDILPYFHPEGGQFAPAGRTIIMHSAFLLDEELRCFDNQFFGIEESVAQLMAPAQRMVMETSFEGLVMAGHTRKSLRGSRLMIAVGEGVSGLDWDWKPGLRTDPSAWLKANAYQGTSTVNRLAYSLGTTGPTIQVDCACSSVLVAANFIHAVLKNHDPEQASMGLAIGGQAIITPWPYIGGSMAGLHGDLGRCATFNATANGFVRGEGSGGVCLSSSEDGETVQQRLCCIVASFNNQDGRSATLTAPNGMSQAACIKASMQEAGLKPSDICMSETHGTATAIGDPIEVGSLVRVFRRHESSLAVMAGKSNVGHTEPVAGCYSLLKLMVSLVYSSAPPNVHFRVLSKNIASFSFAGEEDFPGYFPDEPCDIFGNDYAIGGVTSFGYGGTNARTEVWAPGRRVRNPVEAANRGANGLRIDLFGGNSSRFPKELHHLGCIAVVCPSCLGPMCWLCSAAVSGSVLRTKHRCSVVREVGADYENCSDCYSGTYHFGGAFGEPLEPDQRVYIVGTMNAWGAPIEMDELSPGSYVGALLMGETRTEQFHLVLERDRGKAIQPVTAKADETARIVGPQEEIDGQHWFIDGFFDGASEGAVYQVRFDWNSKRRSISWKAVNVGEYVRAMLESYEHSYFITRRLTGWRPERMLREGEAWVWYGPAGGDEEEEFQFLRDRDITQAIYPSHRGLVQGPDDGGSDRGWALTQSQGEALTVRLVVRDGVITVAATSASQARSWASTRRPPHERYFAVGTWSGWRREPLEPDQGAVQVQRIRFRMGQAGRSEFQLVEHGGTRMYPAAAHARPGQVPLCCGDNAEGLCWEVVGPPGQMVEIRLDLSAEDAYEMLASYVVL
uniref:Type I polyketide synthase n=1 Tax=Gambierdiscus polynesiensis TaxID=439318 RepID=A0A1S6K7V7_9DINO|nr:type I polyketide synthase [Gambierdiscus polynesiensis]